MGVVWASLLCVACLAVLVLACGLARRRTRQLCQQIRATGRELVLDGSAVMDTPPDAPLTAAFSELEKRGLIASHKVLELDGSVELDDASLATLLAKRLNEIVEAEPEALDALVRHRVPCGSALAAHPTVQIDGTTEGGLLGVVGLLCGLCGSTLPGGSGRITAELTQDGDGTVRLIGFSANKDPYG